MYLHTDNQKVFQNTNWGRFKIENYSSDRIDPIIKNRNAFVNDNHIKCQLKKTPKYVYKLFDELKQYCKVDHMEIYNTFDNKYVLISSPYCAHDEYYEQFGWVKINPIYCMDAHTYMKIVPMRNGVK